MDISQVPARVNITGYAGDTFTATLSFTTSVGGVSTPMDFTGASARMQISNNRAAVVTLTSPSGGITFPQTDQIKITLTNTQTADLSGQELNYDLQVTDTLGAVRTYIFGKFQILADL